MPTMWLTDLQKMGVAACMSGSLFFIAGTLLLFDRALLAMGNILFLAGLTMIIGPTKSLAFFFSRPPHKLRGTASFFAGIVLILIRWPIFGFAAEMYGVWILFGDFAGTVGSFAGNVPVIGPYLQKAFYRVGELAGKGAGAGGGGGPSRESAEASV